MNPFIVNFKRLWLYTLVFSILLAVSAQAQIDVDPYPLDISEQDLNDLLQFQLYGEESVRFSGDNNALDENYGYVGSAGYLSFGARSVIAPDILVAGNFYQSNGNQGGDWKGYVRVGGNISGGGPHSSFFRDTVHVTGTINQSNWQFDSELYSAGANPPDSIRPLPAYTIPQLVSTSCAVITDCTTANDYNTGDHNRNHIVDVRTNPDSVVNIYYNNVTIGTNGALLFRARPNQLVRVFVIGNLSMGNDSWFGMGDPNNLSLISGDDYRGNLMVYVNGNVSHGHRTKVVGSFIVNDDWFFSDDAEMVGQLIGKNVGASVRLQGDDFNYVPFNPPVLTLPIADNGYYMVYEQADSSNALRFFLDREAVVDVTLSFHFQHAVTSNPASLSTDFSPTLSQLAQAYSITIPRGRTTPLADFIVPVLDDDIEEPMEPFVLVIDRVEGAVLPNYQSTMSIDMAIEDNDNGNIAPTIVANQKFWTFENEPSRVWYGGLITDGGDTINGNTPSIIQASYEPDSSFSYSIISNNGMALLNSSNTCADLFSINTTTGELTPQTSINYENLRPAILADGCRLLVRVANDNHPTELFSEAWISISILNVNEPPTIASSSNHTIAEDSVFTLYLSTTDPENQNLTCQVLEGPTGLTVNWNSNNCIVNWTPGDDDVDQTHPISIQALDQYGLADTSEFTISVTNVNDVPVITAAARDTVAEDTELTIDIARLTITDPDNSTEDFTLIVDPGESYTVTGTSSLLPALNFNSFLDSILIVNVRVFDGTDTSAVFPMPVVVSSVNDVPELQNPGQQSLVEEQAFSLTLVANDTADHNSNLYYGLLNGPSWLSVAGATISGTPDDISAQDTTISITAWVTDNIDTAFVTVSLTIQAVNDAPIITAVQDLSTLEDTPITLTLDNAIASIIDPDNSTEDFELIVLPGSNYTVTGTTVLPNLNYNGPLSVPVRVFDGTDTSTTVQLPIAVIPVDDAPVMDDVTIEIPENSAGLIADTLVATDVDGDAIQYVILDGNEEGLFSLNRYTGELVVVNDPDYETLNSYTIRVIAQSNALADTATISISILDVNEPPVLVTDSVSVRENSTAGTIIDTLIATDVDTPLDELQFSITDPRFVISNEGVLSVASNAVLDYESTPQISLEVSVSDGALSVSKILTVILIDVNENPRILTDTIHIAEDILPGVTGATIATVDPDGDILNYRILETNTPFQIDHLGQVSLIPGQTIDYEAQTSHTITVQVDDSKGGIATRQVSVQIINVIEYSEVEIILIADKDSLWNRPDTIWTNDEWLEVTWERVVNGTKQTVQDADTLTSEGILRIIREWNDETADFPGADTVYAIVNRTPPTIAIDLPEKRKKPTHNTVEEKDENPEDNIYYTNNPDLEVDYTVYFINEKLKKDSTTLVLVPEMGEGENELIFTYTDPFGNAVSETVYVVLDTIPPVVKILGPADSSDTKLYVSDVEWTVDGELMTELTRQSLVEGENMIIRIFRDKAGNEGADTVFLFLDERRTDILLALEEPLVQMDERRLKELYAKNPPEKGEVFALSVYNVQDQKESELQFGSGSNTKKADGQEPYPGTQGRHLGPTLRMEIKVPHLGGTDAAGNLRGGNILSMLESDGMIALGGGSGDDRNLITLDEYISDHCLVDAFDGLSLEEIKETPIAQTTIEIELHLYDHIGQFVDKMVIRQSIDKAIYVNDAGVVTLYLEIKPDENGKLKNQNGRNFATGAYILRGIVRSNSKYRCDTPEATKGSVRKVSEPINQTFGYRRF
jgi:hypothetical protein